MIPVHVKTWVVLSCIGGRTIGIVWCVQQYLQCRIKLFQRHGLIPHESRYFVILRYRERRCGDQEFHADDSVVEVRNGVFPDH